MAFINEWLDKEDRVEYDIPEYGKYTPTKWTIDKERNIVLFEYSNGGEDAPDFIKMALVIKDEIFCYRMFRNITGNNILWETIITTPTINLYAADMLKEALIIYGDTGSPFEHIENVDVEILYEGFVI